MFANLECSKVGLLFIDLVTFSGTMEKLKDFLELFELFAQSLDRKLIEKTIRTISRLPSAQADSSNTWNRVRKIVDITGALMSSLKRVRQNLLHATHCQKVKHKSCPENPESHHHLDSLDEPYACGIASERVCCLASLFMTMLNLVKEADFLSPEVVQRLLKVTSAVGTCCCFPPRTLLSAVVRFLKSRSGSAYPGLSLVLLERTLFKQLGGFPEKDACAVCSRRCVNWDFVELYCQLFGQENPRLCQAAIAHLLKVLPLAKFNLRKCFLEKIFYPTFLTARDKFLANEANAVAKFLAQASLSAMAALVSNSQIYEEFLVMDGLRNVTGVVAHRAFTKHVYALLEAAAGMDIWRRISDQRILFRDEGEDPTLNRSTSA